MIFIILAYDNLEIKGYKAWSSMGPEAMILFLTYRQHPSSLRSEARAPLM